MAPAPGTDGHPKPREAAAYNEYIRMDKLHGCLFVPRAAYLVTLPDLIPVLVAGFHLGSQGA